MTEAVVGQPRLLSLLGLARRARAAQSAVELAFLAANESTEVAPYRQSALWLAGAGVKTLSGVVQPESNAPYVQWLNRVCETLQARGERVCTVQANDLPPELGAEWGEWLPAWGLWLSFGNDKDPLGQGGFLFVGDQPWADDSMGLMSEWIDTWAHAWRAKQNPSRWSLLRTRKSLRQNLSARPDLPYWKRPRVRWLLLILVVMAFPVRLTVLAPAELVPAHPAVIRAPLDGVIGQFHVSPNQAVKAGQLLFTFDEAALAARRDVAAQALATTEAEYRQIVQQALLEAKSKAAIASQLGKIEEKRAESDYVTDQLQRSRVLAPQDGIALFEDPNEWQGRPVQTGERVMRIALPGDVEVEAWVALGDAIPLQVGSPVKVYLSADPLSAVSAKVRYISYDSVARPNGVFAYRLRATLERPSERRIGAKGTAKLHGDWVPLVYWVMRRPLATIRQTVGL